MWIRIMGNQRQFNWDEWYKKTIKQHRLKDVDPFLLNEDGTMQQPEWFERNFNEPTEYD